MRLLFVLFILSLCYAEDIIFVLKKANSFQVTRQIPKRDFQGFVKVKLSELGLSVSPYMDISRFKIPRCEITVPDYPNVVHNSLIELIEKRSARRELLDQKLRLMLTDNVLQLLNELERKHALSYEGPIHRSMDAFELAARVALLVSLLSN